MRSLPSLLRSLLAATDPHRLQAVAAWLQALDSYAEMLLDTEAVPALKALKAAGFGCCAVTSGLGDSVRMGSLAPHLDFTLSTYAAAPSNLRRRTFSHTPQPSHPRRRTLSPTPANLLTHASEPSHLRHLFRRTFSHTPANLLTGTTLSRHLGEDTRAHGHAELSRAELLRRKNRFYSILFSSLLFILFYHRYDFTVPASDGWDVALQGGTLELNIFFRLSCPDGLAPHGRGHAQPHLGEG